MVVRRIREHVGTHNWFAVGIDLAIVVIGVFLGTQASNWNAHRIAEETGQTYRARLIEDLTANEADLTSRIAYYRDVREHALMALEGFSSPAATLGEEFVVHAFQASQINVRPLKRWTYDELVSVGGLASLGDESLRERAALYFNGVQAIDNLNSVIPPYRDRVRREIPYVVEDRIRRVCGDRLRDVKGTLIGMLPKSCKTDLDTGTIEAAVTQLRSAKEMDRDLNRYIIDLDQKIGFYEGGVRRARDLRVAIAEVDA